MKELTKARVLVAIYYDDYSPTYPTLKGCMHWLKLAGVEGENARLAVQEIALEQVELSELAI